MTEVAVTTAAIRRANLQSDRHHQQTNTQLFTGRMPFLSPNQQCRSTEGKVHYPESDGDDEGTGHDTAERLVSGDVQPVRLDGVIECTVRDEEEHQRRHDALGHRPSEHALVEQRVVVAGNVQLRIAHRVRLAHILR